MIRFEDEVQKIVIEHGIAGDRLNKDLINLVTAMYLHGFTDAHCLMDEGHTYSLDGVRAKVIKNQETYEV